MSIWIWLIIAAIWLAWNAGSFIIGAKERFAKDAGVRRPDKRLIYAAYIGYPGFYYGGALAKKAIRKGKTGCKAIYAISKNYPQHVILD